MIGQTIAQRYELEGILGSGGRGVVYRGRDAVLGRQIAVKFLRAEISDTQAESRFRREAQTAARLEHPSIVPIYDFGRSEHGAYLVMPRVDGDSLQYFIEAKELTPEDVIEIGAQAADALVYSHCQGVVHRDIKPGNLMAERLDDSWRVRLLDFGIALDFGSATEADRLTQEAGILGTPLYLSPEQLLEEDLDARSDIYSLGVVLYECLTGRPPFTGRLPSLIQKILTDIPEAPSRAGISLDAELEELVLRCLAKTPDERPVDAREVRDCLRRLQGSAKATVATTEVPGRQLSRRRTAIVGRANELRLASESLEAACEGRSQLLLIGGDAGIGKSAILREIKNIASAAGVRTLCGHFVEKRENSFPYHAFCEALQDFFKSAQSYSMRDPDLAGVASDLIQLFPMLEDLPQFAEAAAQKARSATAMAEMTKSKIFETLARAFARLGGSRPLVIMLEDLHQADVSVEALQYIFRRLASTPTLIVAAFETPLPATHSLESLLEWSSAESAAERIQLGPLSKQEVERLLKQQLGQPEIEDSCVEILYRTSGGHPLYLSQLVRSWLDTGALLRDEHGCWQLAGGRRADESVPDSMGHILKRRLDGLKSEERSVIEALAVIGRRAQRLELEALVVVGESLRELVSRGFLIQDARHISFSNTLLRGMAYRLMAEAERYRLHRLFAEFLERTHRDHIDRVSYRLAHHWSEGQEVTRAVEHLMSAARQALAGRSPEDAVGLADRVLAFCDGGVEKSCLFRREALAILARGHLEAGRETQALMVAKKAREEDLASPSAMLAGAEAAWALGELDFAALILESGLAVAEDDAEAQELLELRSKIEDLLMVSPGTATTGELPTNGAALDASSSLLQAARSFEKLGEALLVQGEYLAAREAFETAHSQRVASGEATETAADHLANLAQLALKLGNYAEALSCCEQGLALARDAMQMAHFEALAGLVCCSVGDYEEASRHVARGFDYLADAAGLKRHRRPEIEALLQRTRGNVWVGLGDAHKALGHYRDAVALLADSGAGAWERSIALFNLGEALMHLGEDEKALEQLERALVEKSAIGDRWGLAYVHHAKACILRRRGELEDALREATIGAGIASRIGDPKIEAMLHIELGQILQCCGRREEAEKRFFRALAQAENASALPEVAAARRALKKLQGKVSAS